MNTWDIDLMLVKCWPIVSDDGPALNQHCVDAWYSLVMRQQRCASDKITGITPYIIAPVAETGFSHRLTPYTIVGHFF